jgi:hypothetical protein
MDVVFVLAEGSVVIAAVMVSWATRAWFSSLEDGVSLLVSSNFELANDDLSEFGVAVDDLRVSKGATDATSLSPDELREDSLGIVLGFIGIDVFNGVLSMFPDLECFFPVGVFEGFAVGGCHEGDFFDVGAWVVVMVLRMVLRMVRWCMMLRRMLSRMGRRMVCRMMEIRVVRRRESVFVMGVVSFASACEVTGALLQLVVPVEFLHVGSGDSLKDRAIGHGVTEVIESIEDMFAIVGMERLNVADLDVVGRLMMRIMSFMMSFMRLCGVDGQHQESGKDYR